MPKQCPNCGGYSTGPGCIGCNSKRPYYADGKGYQNWLTSTLYFLKVARIVDGLASNK